jgi:hypothetical protein
MRKLYFIIILLLTFSFTGVKAQNIITARIDTAAIRSIVNEVNSDSVRSVIQSLQNYGTRFLSNPNRRQIYKWIKNKFISYGYTDVTIDSFYCNTTWNQLGITMQYNVIAKLPGTAYPNQYYITGGHYDSFSYGSVYNAPGADDNASGTAAVLEAARVIKKRNYQPASSLLFIAFAAEELMMYGDSGSEHYAYEARQANMNIKLMVNNDMISNSPFNPAYSQVKINSYDGFASQAAFAAEMTRKYSLVTPVAGALNQAADGYSFYNQNYPTVYFEEYNFSPFYHSSSDMIGNYNMAYCAEVIKASCATLLSYMENTVGNEKNISLPNEFVLNQNYPNPFNPSTTIEYTVPNAGTPYMASIQVSIKVYDVLGREINTIVDGLKSPGKYSVQFSGTGIPSGIYFYVLNSGGTTITKKMMLLK